MPTKKKNQPKSIKSAPAKKTGRPTKYTKQVTDEILHRIVAGESLNRILKDQHLPSMSTVFSWLTDESKPEFLDKYNQAKELQAEYYADELIDIADDASNDYVEKVLATVKWCRLLTRNISNDHAYGLKRENGLHLSYCASVMAISRKWKLSSGRQNSLKN